MEQNLVTNEEEGASRTAERETGLVSIMKWFYQEYTQAVERRGRTRRKMLQSETEENIIRYIDERDWWKITTLEKIRKAVQKLRNNKSPEQDEILTEIVRYRANKLLKCIHRTKIKIRDSKEMLQEWIKAIISPTFKKWGKISWDNYRYIAQLNTGYKILSIYI